VTKEVTNTTTCQNILDSFVLPLDPFFWLRPLVTTIMAMFQSDKRNFSEKISKRAILSYVFDYAIIFILLGAFLALDVIEPYHQQFSLRNYTLQYKFAVKERVSNALVVAISCGAPLAIICFWTLVVDGIFSHKVYEKKRKHTFRERLWELNCGLLGLGLAISMQYVVVGSLKNAIGKPRPDLIDRCQPLPGSADPLPFGLSNHTICTQTDNAILKDGFRSFPSGHSSTSFGGLFYLSLYLSAKLHIMDSRGEVWKMFVVLTPSLAAALIAGTRIMDARHHPFDVLSGCLIGILMAWLAYRQYFPSISDFRAKGRAYPMRTWGKEPIGIRPADKYDYQDPILDEEDGKQTSTNYMGDSIQLLERRHRKSGSEPTSMPSNTIAAASSANQPSIPVLHPASAKRLGDESWDEGTSDTGSYASAVQPQYTLTGPSATDVQDTYGPMAKDTSYNSPGKTKETLVSVPQKGSVPESTTAIPL